MGRVLDVVCDFPLLVAALGPFGMELVFGRSFLPDTFDDVGDFAPL